MRPFHSPRGAVLSLGFLTLFALQAPNAGAAEAKKPTQFINGVPDTGQFLPNSAILAKVADRKVNVLAYRTYFFSGDPRIRSKSDSLGRAEFLTNMIRKEVLGLTALSAGINLGFEDRLTLRDFRANTLSNRLFETAVLNGPQVSEDSLRKVHAMLCYDVRARVLNFSERAPAEAARRSLASGATTWEKLAAQLAPAGQKPADPKGAWVAFQSAPLDVALLVWPLTPGATSDVVAGAAGYQIIQVLGRRPHAMPIFKVMIPAIRNALSTYSTAARKVALTREAKQGLDVKYDTTNARWAAQRYFLAVQSDTGHAGGLVIDENVPEFSAEDTVRIILTSNEGRVSLGDVSIAYGNMPVALRPAINTPDRLMDFADGILLEPHLVELAVQRGLDKDPVAIAQIENRREEMLVTRMVEDSVFRRVVVSQKDRLDYYQKNRNQFVTFAEARAAYLVRDTKSAADSVRARLLGGESPLAILRADSLAGNRATGTKVETSEMHGTFHKLLFEEMRPGQSLVVGPDRDGNWACITMLSFDPGRQMRYEEVRELADESVQNLKEEQALNAFVERLMKRFPIEAHYELLMKIRLTTPADGERESD